MSHPKCDSIHFTARMSDNSDHVEVRFFNTRTYIAKTFLVPITMNEYDSELLEMAVKVVTERLKLRAETAKPQE